MPAHCSKRYLLLLCILAAARGGSVAVAGHKVRKVRMLKPGEQPKKPKAAPAPAKKARASGNVSLRNPYSSGASGQGSKALVKTRYGSLLDAGQYGEIRDASFALMKKYPPDKYYYIGLGRSPASMIAFIQNLSTRKDPTDIAMNFPASGVRGAEPISYKKNYYEYFDRLVPADAWKGQRKILLVDRVGVYSGQLKSGSSTSYQYGTAGGSSIVAMLKVFKAYIRDRKLKVKVEGVGYAPDGLTHQFNQIKYINTKGFAIVDAMGSSLHGNTGRAFDEIAEHPMNYIHSNPVANLQVRKEYGKYQSRMLQRMVADKKVDSFLTKTLGYLLQ